MATTSKVCAVQQKSAGWCEGSTEIAGIRKKFYFTACANIADAPVLPTDENGHPTSVTLSGSYVMRADKVFHYIDGIPNKNQFTSEGQGDIPSQTQLNKLTAIFPSIGEDATGICLSLNNTPSVVIFQDNKGRWRVFRNEYGTFKATVKQDSGQGVTGELSTTIDIEDTDIIACPFLPAGFTITTEEGEIELVPAAKG